MRGALLRLVRLFPAPFRTQFGADLEAHLEHDYDEARARGRFAALGFFLATGFDLARAGLAERWNPTLIDSRQRPLEGRGMRGMMMEWLRDLRHAGRSLMRSPGFTAVTVTTLGLAIGANAGMFSVVKTVLLDPLPFPSPNRLVFIGATAPGSQFPDEFGVANEFYVQYHEQSRLLESVALYNSFTNTLRVGDRVERIRMSMPTWNLFATLGARPLLGRLPVANDQDSVAVLSHALWQTWFGGDSSVIGKSYQISGSSRIVIAVMGPEFRFPNDQTMLWLPTDVNPQGLTPGRFGNPLVARMKPGATTEAVALELTALASHLPERFGGSANYAKLISQHRAIVRPLTEQLLGSVSSALWVLLGAVGIVLLIACANVANLFMVRSEGRQRELAVRRAIGAGRSQLVRLQMAEAVAVALAAGGVAVVLARVSLPILLRAAPQGVPRLDDVSISAATLLFTAGAAIVAALACGLAPALRASAPDLTRLREGGRGATRRHHWLRNGLVVAQTALALVLLIGSGLLLRSYAKLSHVNPGYDTRDIFSFQIAPEQSSLRDGPSFAQFSLNFMDRLRALPGVESVGLIENVPLDESTSLVPFRTPEMSADPNAGTRLNFTFAAADYFRTMGIPVLAGRPFTREDNISTLGNVVISRTAAKKLWPGQDPIGRTLQRNGLTTWETVVGVVEDVMQDDFRTPAQATVYFPMVGQTPTSWRLPSPGYVVKSSRAETIGTEIRALVHEIAPEAPMYREYTMSFLAKRSMVQLSFTMLTLGIVAGLAMILGAVGLYGVLSYVVAERTREIGVRMALGAEARQVRRMVVAQGARVVGLGAVIGVVAALATTRALGSLLFGVEAFDLPTFVAMSASMVGIGLLASYMPARRASSVDPIESLRGD